MAIISADVARFRLIGRIVASWAALALMDIRLKLLPHRWNEKLLRPDPRERGGSPSSDAKDADAIMRCARPVLVAARHPFVFNMSCLRQALVIRSRLRARGFGASLVYGARKSAAGFDAHAWVESGGLRINGLESGGFHRFGAFVDRK